MSSQVFSPQRGYIFWAQVPYLPQGPLDVVRQVAQGTVEASLTFKTRPVLVVQNQRDNVNSAHRFVVVSGVHSIKPGEQQKLRRINHPTDFLLDSGECGLDRPSVIFLNQLVTLHKNLLRQPIGALSAERLAELNVKLAIALGLLD